MRRALVLEIAASVQVVELESQAYPLSYVYSEKRFEVVFAVGPVAAFVVRYVGYRRKRVGEVKLVDRGYEVVVGLGEHELLVLAAVDEYAVDARRAEVAQRA